MLIKSALKNKVNGNKCNGEKKFIRKDENDLCFFLAAQILNWKKTFIER